MSASLWRATMRQNTHAEVIDLPRSCIILWSIDGRSDHLPEGERDGHLPEVQAQDPEERQPREARLGLVSQNLPGEGGAGCQVDRPMKVGAPDDAGAPIGSNGRG